MTFHKLVKPLLLLSAVFALNAAPSLASAQTVLICDSTYVCVQAAPLDAPPIVNGNRNIVIGTNNQIDGDDNTYVGNNGSFTGTGNNGVGTGIYIHADNAEGLGNYAKLTSDGATCVGDQCSAGDPINFPSGIGPIGGQSCVGTQCNAIGGQSTTVGALSGTTAEALRSGAFGYGAQATASDCLALGAGVTCSESYTAVFGNYRLTNLMPGIDPYDAATILQLNQAAAVFGKGSVFLNGQLNATQFNVFDVATQQFGVYSNVYDAFNAVNGSLETLSQTPVVTPPPVNPPPATSTDPNAVHYDNSSKAKVTLEGSQGTVITNLHDGAVSATSSDAINGSQLFNSEQQSRTYTDNSMHQAIATSENWAKAYTDQQIRGLRDDISRVSAMGTASANAMANCNPAAGNNCINAGLGFAGGHSAIAVGYKHQATEHVSWSVSGAVSGNQRTIGAGVGYSW